MKSKIIHRVTNLDELVTLPIDPHSELPYGWSESKQEAIDFRTQNLDAEMRNMVNEFFNRIQRVRAL